MMFLRQETAGHVKYVLPRAKNGLKKRKEKGITPCGGRHRL